MMVQNSIQLMIDQLKPVLVDAALNARSHTKQFSLKILSSPAFHNLVIVQELHNFIKIDTDHQNVRYEGFPELAAIGYTISKDIPQKKETISLLIQETNRLLNSNTRTRDFMADELAVLGITHGLTNILLEPEIHNITQLRSQIKQEIIKFTNNIHQRKLIYQLAIALLSETTILLEFQQLSVNEQLLVLCLSQSWPRAYNESIDQISTDKLISVFEQIQKSFSPNEGDLESLAILLFFCLYLQQKLQNKDFMMSIPGNNFVMQKLKDLTSTNKAISFIGAGASAGLYPLWNGLMKILVDESFARGVVSENDISYWKNSIGNDSQQLADAIREKIGENIYKSIIQDIFSRQIDTQGNSYTKIQRILMSIKFKGYVTINYDPGLIYARQIQFPINPNALDFGTWADIDIVNSWITNNVFDQEICPILYAHGYFRRPETIVLGLKDYSKVYANTYYKRLFEKLWTQEYLVFIGFSFSDPWLKHIVQNFSIDSNQDLASPPRHIALIGLYDNEQYSPEMRRKYRILYNTDVIFYPIIIDANGEENHDALKTILEDLL